MKKVKNILIGLLVFSIIALCFIFNGPLVTEASSDDENSRPYTQLKNTTSDPETIYSDKYQKIFISKLKRLNK
ncbi:MAG: hypothetical protein ACLSU6_14450 [Thomasclavelia ramosa]